MKKPVIAAITLLLAGAAYAKPTIQAVQAAMPALAAVTSVTETPMKGLYQVTTDTSLFFVDNELKYVLAGAMFNMKTRENLSLPALEQMKRNAQAKTRAHDKEKISNIKLADAIVEVKGTGKRVVYVFTDPLCPFCKRFEATLDATTDITIYRFITPFKGPVAVATTEKVWCSTDKLSAWKDAVQGKALPENHCETPTAKNIDFSRSLNVEGTPTMFKPNGDRSQGALDKTTFETWLAQ